ncbi:MAG: GIY-YIG nuclease family protein [Stellaceae bacterium]
MIRSYGLHWHVERVFWGKQIVNGTLMGAASKSKVAKPIDFRDQRGIYALYADYELVYIGQAGSGNDRLFKRLRAHKRDHLSERWNRFSWFGTQWVTQQSLLSKDIVNIQVDISKALNIIEAVTTAISEP